MAERSSQPMKPTTLLLTQLLPLLAFIVVDLFVTDTRISILAAIVFAVGQLVFTWVRSRRFEWFVVLDVVLIAGLGGISIALENDLFFKVKPAIVEGLTVVLMVALLLAPGRFLIAYFGRLTPGVDLRPEAIGTLKSTLGLMCGVVAVHIGLVLYTAFYASKEVWAFVSGPGFYILFLPVLAFAWFARRGRSRTASADDTQVGDEP
jgi:intracellular septation protein A